MKKTLSGIAVDCVKGDIAAQKGYDAVVNAANAWLRPGGGVAGFIHAAAGPGLLEECRPLAPIKTGEAVITKGCNLPNRYVIHCLGPVYGKDEPAHELLANCFRNALKLAEQHKVTSIAIPVISTGAFGYPFKEAVQVSLTTLKEMMPELKSVKKITFVVRSDEKYNILKKALANFY
ncbi:Appr-1-p processing protein [Desulforamulus profundi]|uniref:Appr-1-p processing protein n=1 Tax=Desulforamulus profundi TaxID=1383067 RepID=A0A2C6MHH7_9FIRM|nr:macro domain-containing protein [Desulforamulus profundi]PHJ39728.1 Appr-1-p processing protein [Desulforamulus profundi]